MTPRINIGLNKRAPAMKGQVIQKGLYSSTASRAAADQSGHETSRLQDVKLSKEGKYHIPLMPLIFRKIQNLTH